MKIIKCLLLVVLVLSFTGCVKCTRERVSIVRETDTTIEAPAEEYMILDISDSVLNAGAADTLDLGYVSGGEKIETTLLMRNTGKVPLVILEDSKSCNCVKATYGRKPIQPGEMSELKVEFDSKGFYGRVFKPVRFTTNLSEKEYSLIVMADVK